MSDIRNAPSEQEINNIRAKWLPRAYCGLACVIFSMYLGMRRNFDSSPKFLITILKNRLISDIFVDASMILGMFCYLSILLYVQKKTTGGTVFTPIPISNIYEYLKHAWPLLISAALILLCEVIILVLRAIF
jgi:Na+/citrate or Na+/malate symporter